MSDTIAALAKRFWSIHPREIQDLGITREQFYEREMRALFAIQAARTEALEKHKRLQTEDVMNLGAQLGQAQVRIEVLKAALQMIVLSSKDGRSIEIASEALAPEQDK
jgi:hypothetical protein